MRSDIIAQTLAPFHALFEAFRNEGFCLYAVGGCVRDWLMGKTPKDIDFTTDALPEQTKDVLSKLGLKILPVGEVFGTIATLIARKQYEITTFRVRESYTRGSRHPIVCYGKSLAADLERRDLTINAMAADDEGNIIDPFDGMGDIDRHLLRVPRSSYDQTVSIFGDDPLRILRLARFMARLDFDADDAANRAARDMAGSILSVSHERWFSEIDGTLRAAHMEKGMKWLWNVGILELILPEFCALRDCYKRPVSLSDGIMAKDEASLFELTWACVKNAPLDGDFKWAALLAMVGYSASNRMLWAAQTSQMLACEIMQRFKFSSNHTDHILKMIRLLPDGEPEYRTARELAIELGDAILDWNRFQDIRLSILPESCRKNEEERLERWRSALSPYFENPASAEVALPKNLSQALSQTLGVRGKTLGLCIAQCRDAVLDQLLHETDSCDAFVEWVRAHF